MNSSSHISLLFGSDVPDAVRPRIRYAFQVFAAIYGYSVAESSASCGAMRCVYGAPPSNAADPHTVRIPFLYRDGIFEDRKLSLLRRRYADEDFHLFFGIDVKSGHPDWLGEIFVWLSGCPELSATARDSVGRIPYSETIFGRCGLSPRKPHAALLMAWMENVLNNGAASAKEALPKAPSPTPDAEHLVICSHDIDFYFVSLHSSLARLAKNLALAIFVYKDWSFFFENSKMLAQLCGGKRVGDFLPELLKRAQDVWDFRSSLFVVPRRGHRRDPNYRLDDLAPQLLKAEKAGFSVDVHGSYRSVTEARTLKEEALLLAAVLGGKPQGNRQHWLRFGEHRSLFDEIERAGLLSDSTLGFSDTVGFRNGASFAFPPYNFALEKPYEFLEMPLVLMDASLLACACTLRTSPQQLAEEILAESRRRAWGGISVLWHNPIEPVQVSSEINSIFWNCAKQQRKLGEKWLSVKQFLARSLHRYQSAGLLKRINYEATPNAASGDTYS